MEITPEVEISAENATALSERGYEVAREGDLEYGADLLKQSLAIRRALGDTRGIALVLGNLGTLALQQCQYLQARSYLDECVVLFQEGQSPRDVAIALYNLARAAVGLQDYADAHRYLTERLALCQEMHEKKFVPITLALYAEVARAGGQFQRAALLEGAYEALTVALDTQFLDGVEQEDYNRTVEALCSTLGEGAFRTAWEEGRALSCEQAIANVLSIAYSENPVASRRE